MKTKNIIIGLIVLIGLVSILVYAEVFLTNTQGELNTSDDCDVLLYNEHGKVYTSNLYWIEEKKKHWYFDLYSEKKGRIIRFPDIPNATYQGFPTSNIRGESQSDLNIRVDKTSKRWAEGECRRLISLQIPENKTGRDYSLDTKSVGIESSPPEYKCSTNQARTETCVCLSGTKRTCYYETCGEPHYGVCTLGEWILI